MFATILLQDTDQEVHLAREADVALNRAPGVDRGTAREGIRRQRRLQVHAGVLCPVHAVRWRADHAARRPRRDDRAASLISARRPLAIHSSTVSA
jgi:hypothetical protein